jgi:hypothetical protein
MSQGALPGTAMPLEEVSHQPLLGRYIFTTRIPATAHTEANEMKIILESDVGSINCSFGKTALPWLGATQHVSSQPVPAVRVTLGQAQQCNVHITITCTKTQTVSIDLITEKLDEDGFSDDVNAKNICQKKTLESTQLIQFDCAVYAGIKHNISIRGHEDKRLVFLTITHLEQKLAANGKWLGKTRDDKNLLPLEERIAAERKDEDERKELGHIAYCQMQLEFAQARLEQLHKAGPTEGCERCARAVATSFSLADRKELLSVQKALEVLKQTQNRRCLEFTDKPIISAKAEDLQHSATAAAASGSKRKRA